jgi:hypothetical protein
MTDGAPVGVGATAGVGATTGAGVVGVTTFPGAAVRGWVKAGAGATVGAGTTTGATAGAAAGAWAIALVAQLRSNPVATQLVNDRRGWKFIGKRIDGKEICNLI